MEEGSCDFSSTGVRAVRGMTPTAHHFDETGHSTRKNPAILCVGVTRKEKENLMEVMGVLNGAL